MKVTQTIKKNKTIRKVYDKYFAKSHRSIKRFIAIHVTKQKEKEEKIINEFINTITSTPKNSTPKKFEEIPQQQREGISFIALGREESFSSNFMNSVKGYQEEWIEFIFCVDESIKDHAVNTALEEFREKQSTKVIYFSDSDSTLHRLKVAVQFAQYNRVILFTMRDITNRNSLVSYLKSTVKISKPVILHLLGKDSITKNGFLENPSIGALSGCIFETTFLSSILDKISKNCDFFIPYVIFREISDNDVLTINDSRYWTINERAGTTFRELSSLCRDILNLNEFWQGQDAAEIKDVMYGFLRFVESYLAPIRKNKTYLNCFIATVVIFVSRFNNLLSEKDYGKVLYDYSAIFDFGQLLKGDSLHLTHLQIIEKLIPTKENTIAVMETEYMQDLKNCLVSTLKEKYDVIYQTKSEFYDYVSFHQLIVRTLIQPAQFIVTSNSLHKYFSFGKKVINLWHGSGMLKKTKLPYNNKIFWNNYFVASSEACVLPWSKLLSISEENVIPLGHVQTDCLFDKQFEKVSREKICRECEIPNDGKIVFFAPTFRRNPTPGHIPPRYYNLCMDIEKLSEKLAEKGLYLIAKRHHVFFNLLKETGVDWSGIRTSKNRHFLVDDTHTFQELIVASDIYVTDYSSGIFYAVLRNMPVVLYAPDLNEFREGPTDFMINYPEDVAGIFVGEPSIDSFMKAIEDAETDVHSERYANFKEIHVAACDGHAKERVMKYLATWDGNQFAEKSQIDFLKPKTGN